jgi:uncharacterized protein (TIGR01777 family)
MRVLIAGSSGFLGSHLVGALRAAGHDVRRLVRRAPRGATELTWDPDRGSLDVDALRGIDAVVNLAGVNVGRRWTDGYKRTIRDSRLHTTATLARTLAALGPDAPGTWLNASGVGFYGDTGERTVDETSPPGDSFLSGVCRDWEAATAPAADAGVRVVLLRTGLPLHHSGGLLKPLLLPGRLGLLGRLGGGAQYWPWISLHDWLGAVRFLLDREDVNREDVNREDLNRADLSGAVNMVGPAPVTNARFTAALGRVLHRPTVVPLPGFALRLAVGEFAGEALASQRVLPAVLLGAGYPYAHRDVDSALRAALQPVDPALDRATP